MNLTSIENLLNSVDDFFYTYLLTALLILVGIYLTARSRLVQLRHFGTMVNSLSGSRSGAQGGISSFQAFAVGLAARVGIGNIAGVALAIVAGGPGALLWMWVVALIGMATSFVESTLAQIFKERGRDFTFRGGPAYYIKNGLGSPLWGKIFAAICIVSVGVTVVMVQTNSLAQVITATVPSVSAWMVGVFLVLLTAPVVLGGVRLVARVAEWLAPIMALAYVLMAVVVIILNIGRLPEVLGSVFEGAFGLNQALFGTAGGVLAALLNGVRRGLFSNEAGLGGAACAAGSATVSHPVQQGFIQAFGVVVDTLFVCTATALAILVAGADVLHPGVSAKDSAGTLTQDAIAHLVGEWSRWPMALLVVVLAYTTIIGAFSYAQVCLDYLTDRPGVSRALQIGAVICAGVGSVQQLTTVWTLADVLLGLGAIINLVALVLLSRWVVGALRDWEALRSSLGPDGNQTTFRGDSEHLPAVLPTGTWEGPVGR